MNVHWKDWCWSWNSSTLATWCEELTHWEILWCWERLKAGGDGDDREWDGWMASWTQWTWIWASSGSWWWTGKPSVLQPMGSQKVRHNWAVELNWTATHSSTLAWEIWWTEEPGRLQSMWSQRVRHDWVTSLSLFTFMHWRRKWQPTPVFLPGESHWYEPGGLPFMGSHRIRHTDVT